jgi:putative acetyltransferase
MIIVKRVDPTHAAVSALIRELDEYQLSIYPEESNHLDPAQELSSPGVYFAGAFEGETLVGIGAVKIIDNDGGYGEIKRVYVPESGRGRGVSKLIMSALENHVHDQGITTIRLETGIYQPEALGLYEKLGYQRRESFGDYPANDPMSVFMEKILP